MIHHMMAHAPLSGSFKQVSLASKVLGDESTLLIRQKFDDEVMDAPWTPLVELVSIFACQPRKDIKNAAKTMSLVNNQEGVTVIREVFSAHPSTSKTKDEDGSHTALLLLVVVTYRFHIKSEQVLPTLLRQARKEFVKRRSMTHTILEGSGCKVALVTGKQIERVYFHKERIPKGISLFKGRKGFHSSLVDPFLTLDRVPSRQIHQFAVPSLPVVHHLGTRVDNPELPVGFSTLQAGYVLVCGSTNHEVLSVLKQLTASIATTNPAKQTFVINTHGELNGLIHQLQTHSTKGLPLQIFRLGTNIHLNLCDVILPIAATGDKDNAKARAAWKSHLISQILLSSLHTSEYLTARYSVTLEAQIKKTAEN